MASSASRNSYEIQAEDSGVPGILMQDIPSSRPDQRGNDNSDELRPIAQLKPADGGPAAWRLLCAAFVFEAVLWGFPISFGIFQNYYSHLPELMSSPNISSIGTVAQGLCYLGAPFVTVLAKRYPKYQRHMIWAGWPVCILSLVAGSFTTTVEGLILTQGLMYGLGFVTLTFPIISMVSEWWIARRGMAFGLVASASGAAGVVMPFIIQAMLSRYGYRTTLRATAVAMTVLTGPLIPLFQQRLPPAEQSAFAKMNWSFLKKPLFWLYCTSNVVQGFGFFFPSLFLPSYGTSIGLSATQGALLLALMGVAQILGQLTFGYLYDKQVPVNVLAIVSTVVAAVASFALWGVAKSLGVLIAFSLVFGFFGYGYVSTRVGMGSAVSDDPSTAATTFSIFVFGQGVGNILAGPISESLLARTTKLESYGILRYKAVIIFTGTCMLSSALSIGFWYFRPQKLRAGS